MSFMACTINSKEIRANLGGQLLPLFLPYSKTKPEREPNKMQEMCLKKKNNDSLVATHNGDRVFSQVPMKHPFIFIS